MPNNPGLISAGAITAGHIATFVTPWSIQDGGAVSSLSVATAAACSGNSATATTAGTVTTAAQPSITSVGTLTGLTVTAAISGSVTGNAATVTTNANLTGDVTSVGNATTITSIGGGQLAGLRNRIINGDMRIDQRNAGASQTLTAGAGAYCVDRFVAESTGANATGQRVAGSGADQYAYQFTGAASVTGLSLEQRIEATNIYDLASQTVTFSTKLSNSLLTTVTWTASYATAVDNWASRTQIATGTFTVSSTPTKYSTQISLPANAVNGVVITLSVGAQLSGTWTVGEFQLENGSVATPFERRPIGLELGLCQRYYQSDSGMTAYGAIGNTNDTNRTIILQFKTSMRVAPTIITNTWSGGTPSAGNITTSLVDLTTAAGNTTSALYLSAYALSAEL
jgi:hypothetical protein